MSAAAAMHESWAQRRDDPVRLSGLTARRTASEATSALYRAAFLLEMRDRLGGLSAAAAFSLAEAQREVSEAIGLQPPPGADDAR